MLMFLVGERRNGKKGNNSESILKYPLNVIHNRSLLSRGKDYQSLIPRGRREIIQLQLPLAFLSLLKSEKKEREKTIRNAREHQNPGTQAC